MCVLILEKVKLPAVYINFDIVWDTCLLFLAKLCDSACDEMEESLEKGLPLNGIEFASNFLPAGTAVLEACEVDCTEEPEVEKEFSVRTRGEFFGEPLLGVAFRGGGGVLLS